MVLMWNVPDYAGPGTLTYHLFRDGVEVWNGTGTNCVDEGPLEPGVVYEYTVAASNSVGQGGNSTAVSAAPAAEASEDEDPDLPWTIILIIIAILVPVAIVLWYLMFGKK